ncbi:MAG: hypothetical protein OJF61_000671 [Rhodanobacteraceae bacterium]|nr:MAG: hypothetical protein OJF61_000671 [Rhodanobacteraceae bacterium]
MDKGDRENLSSFRRKPESIFDFKGYRQDQNGFRIAAAQRSE